MSYKRFVGLAAALMLVAGCGNSAATTAPSTAGSTAPSTAPSTAASSGAKLYIPIVSKGFQQQFWQTVKKGAEDEAAKEGVNINFVGPASESQVAQQLDMLQTEFNKKPAAICFAALDSKASIPLLEQFQAAKIPVIGFDSGVASPIPVTTVATDNIVAAGAAADKLAAAIGGTGKVGLIVHDQTSQTGIDRRDGFLKEMAAKYPNIQIIGPQYGGGDQLKSADLAKAMFQANPDIKGFFGTNEGSAIGVVNAVKELNMSGKLVVVGYDSSKGQIDAINSGLELGAITQNPIGIGAQCVAAAVKAIHGVAQPKTIDTGFYWYDKTNITDPKIAALLYQ